MSLETLRKEIDTLDATIHKALIDRSRVIDRLIEIKRGDNTGSAFRPLREAQMLEMLKERHKGTLPLSFAVSLWRNIMSTFTHLQAPFSVHLLALSREMAREFYGFEVDFITETSPKTILEALIKNEKNLGFLPIANWSLDLSSEVQIIAKWRDHVILGSSKIDTDGLKQAVILTNGALNFIARDKIANEQVLGYCTDFEV